MYIVFAQLSFVHLKNFFKSRVLAARGFNAGKEKKDTEKMDKEIKQMKESLQKITKLLEKK